MEWVRNAKTYITGSARWLHQIHNTRACQKAYEQDGYFAHDQEVILYLPFDEHNDRKEVSQPTSFIRSVIYEFRIQVYSLTPYCCVEQHTHLFSYSSMIPSCVRCVLLWYCKSSYCTSENARMMTCHTRPIHTVE